MGLFILSAIGLPCMAIMFFSLLEAAFSSKGLWTVLIESGLDLCQVSIGIVGALFFDFQMRAIAGTWAAAILLLELIITAAAMLFRSRATDMGIVRQSVQACSILFLGIVSMVVPSMLIALAGGH